MYLSRVYEKTRDMQEKIVDKFSPACVFMFSNVICLLPPDILRCEKGRLYLRMRL